MNKCKDCSASLIVCEYCKYNKNGNDKDIVDNKIIFYNNIPDDNKSKKICRVCKKVYTDYPAISRQDNETLICSECGRKEAEQLLEEY